MNWIPLVFIFGIILSLGVRFVFILNGSEVADIHSLQEMGELALRGINPYLALNYNSYPPLAIYLEELTLLLSYWTQIPFYILIKLWPNLADLLITLGIYFYLTTRQSVKKATAVFWSLGFFLNPISIIISSAHGQLDSVVTLITLLSIICLEIKKPKSIYLILSPLLLGLAIAIKPNPLMLLPFFLFYVYKKYDFSWSILFFLIVLSPVGIMILPFAADNFLYVTKKLANYSGAYDFGLPAVIRGFDYFIFNKTDLSINQIFITISKIIFFAGWGVIFWGYRKSLKLLESCFLLYLWFIVSYFGISAQYLSWILPLAILLKDKRIIIFSAVGFFAIMSFYFFLNPKIIMVQLAEIKPFQDHFRLLYALSNAILWSVGVYWLVKRFKRTSD